MAKETITEFLKASAANPEFAGKVAALAAEYGYEFTAEEWLNSAGNVAAEIIRGTYVRLNEGRALLDGELESIAGGGFGNPDWLFIPRPKRQ